MQPKPEKNEPTPSHQRNGSEFTAYTDSQYSRTIEAAVMSERIKEELKACISASDGAKFEDVVFDISDKLLSSNKKLTRLPSDLAIPILAFSTLEGEEVMFNVDAGCAFQRAAFSGKLVGTNYQLRYVPDDPEVLKTNKVRHDFFDIPLGLISAVDRRQDRKVYMATVLDIELKDSRTFKFLFPLDEKDATLDKVISALESHAFSKDPQKTFAFYHKLPGLPDGWDLFNDLTEYKRMGLDLSNPDSPFKLFEGNADGSMCSSYPGRVVVTRSMADSDISECSKFRSRERFPALTYYCKANGASIWRSSQPKEGLWGYVNKADQKMLQSIAATVLPRLPEGDNKKRVSQFKDAKRDEAALHIVDARPKLSAIGNKVMGSGYENVDNYPSTWLYFCDIENIHKMRESLQSLMQICKDPQMLMSGKWLGHLEKTEWLQHLAYIISGANTIVSSVRAGRAVLIHCSDGWDRTAELSCLSQLILDKYYRTIEGFEVLIEKDFAMFGHQFKLRLGQQTKNALVDKEFSPIFLQFLDCVYQLNAQFPTAFEFNSRFLADIAFHAYSQRFGTFLLNTDKESQDLHLKSRTVSLWTYLNSRKSLYKNAFYVENEPSVPEEKMVPDALMPGLRLWEELHMKWGPFRAEHKGPMKRMSVAMGESAERTKRCEEELKRCKQIMERYEQIFRDSGISVDNFEGGELVGSYLVIPVPEKKLPN